MKKIVSVFLCLSLVFALSLSAVALVGENYVVFSSASNVDMPVNEHIGGDVNGDGVVTLLDAVAVLRAVIGETNNISRDGVDANEDGSISVLDVIVVVRHIVGDDVGLGTLVAAR